MLDHGVPAPVSALLVGLGHTVVLASDQLPTDTPDAVVAKVCDDDDLVLVAVVDPAKGIKPATGPPFRLIQLQCAGYLAAERVQAAHDLIRAEHEVSRRNKKRLQIVVTETAIKTFR